MLPMNVDDSRLQAEFKNGVLQVHLPKSAVARPKAIDVKVG
jgi:HSP20 family protein